MSTTIEQLELEIQSNSTSAEKGIDALSASLSKLKTATKGGVGLTAIANQLGEINTALNGMSSDAPNKLSNLATSLQKLSSLSNVKISSSISNQISSIGTAVKSLDGVSFSNLSDLATALAPLSNLGKNNLTSFITQLKKIPEVVKALDTQTISDFTQRIQSLVSALAPLSSQLNTISTAFSKLPTQIKQTTTATNTLSTANTAATKSYVNLWAKARMAYNVIRGAANFIASCITESNSYIENLNLFTASMGEYAAEAKEYAEYVGEVLGIDPGEFMRNQGVFNTIITGFGVASDKAYLMSKNLTQLGYDISSFYNISFEDAMQKLQSGISGELEPLRRLGYDLSVARLQQEAYALGIDKSVSSMTQAEKSQLRYYAIMTQVTTAQGDMARTLNAPANQLRILSAQVTQCARAFGNVFIPILNKVLPYLIALAKVLRSLLEIFASVVGFELPEVDYSGISSASDTVSDLADNTDDATSAAKKLKNAMLGIDELNIISPDDSSGTAGTSGLGTSGSDLGIELPDYDFLGDAVSSKVDEIVKMIEDSLWEITAVISGFLLAIGTILVVTGANIPLGLGLMAVGAVGLAASIAANWSGMSEQLAKTLTIITGVLGGFLLAIGAFLVFSGVNVPLGAALMVAGAVSLATAATINWKFLNGDLKNALSILTGIVGGALLAMGALFAFTGVDVPLGIALMAAGAVSLATAIGLNWDSMSEPMRKAIGTLEAIVGGALLTFGALLALSGVNVPLGIAMIAAGAVAIVSAVALNWNALTSDTKTAVATITAIVSGALIGIGAILAFTGVATPLGIAMIAAGAVGLVATASLNWGALTEKIKTVLKEIGIAVGAALIALGAVLALSGVALPLGIALIAAGAASLAAGVALNWNSIVSKVKEVLQKIGIIAGAALLALGVILCLTGVGIPLGVALIAAGAASLVAGVALNWDTITEKVKEGLNKITQEFEKFKTNVGKKLEKVGDKIGEWAGGVKEYFTKGSDGKNVIDNLKETAESWGSTLKDTFMEKVNDTSSWIGDNVTLSAAVELVKKGWTTVKGWIGSIPTLSQLIALAKSGWESVKTWIGNIPVLSQAIELVKKAWTTVKEWVGSIPTLEQAIKLVKSAWNTVKEWIGNIPTLDQAIKLIKSGWTTVKNWIGSIPTLDQAIQLIKSGWSTVKSWIGNIPVLSQAIELIKSGWTTVKNWIGSIPALEQAIKLVKSGWTTIANFVGTAVSVGISLFKSGWSSISSWIGNSVSVGISLFKSGWSSIKSFFGLSDGGILGAKGGVKLFANGGIVSGQSFWEALPKYANGTSKAHGSLFVAGENGEEMVGHVNGTTEVLNRFQMGQIMYSSIISGMNQFGGYITNLSSHLTTCTNAVINTILTEGELMTANYASPTSYDPTNALSQSVYDDSSSARRASEGSMYADMRDFYRDYVEPTLREIAADTKRQADKDEQTIVQVGGRTITDAVTKQQNANGYKFATT